MERRALRYRGDSRFRASIPFVVAASAFLAASAFAGARHFDFLYEAPTSAPGSFELENWVTWQTNGSNQTDFRHELEIGVTDRMQLSVYFADWADRKHAGATA